MATEGHGAHLAPTQTPLRALHGRKPRQTGAQARGGAREWCGTPPSPRWSGEPRARAHCTVQLGPPRKKRARMAAKSAAPVEATMPRSGPHQTPCASDFKAEHPQTHGSRLGSHIRELVVHKFCSKRAFVTTHCRGNRWPDRRKRSICASSIGAARAPTGACEGSRLADGLCQPEKREGRGGRT